MQAAHPAPACQAVVKSALCYVTGCHQPLTKHCCLARDVPDCSDAYYQRKDTLTVNRKFTVNSIFVCFEHELFVPPPPAAVLGDFKGNQLTWRVEVDL